MNTERIAELQKELADLQAIKAEVEHDMENFDISEHFNEEDIAANLSDQYPPIELFGAEYCPIAIIRAIDPPMWSQLMNDWLDSWDNENVDAYRDMMADLSEADRRIAEAEEELAELESEDEGENA